MYKKFSFNPRSVDVIPPSGDNFLYKTTSLGFQNKISQLFTVIKSIYYKKNINLLDLIHIHNFYVTKTFHFAAFSLFSANFPKIISRN